MDKLFEMLERGEIPTFIEVLGALNEVSDIDWSQLEALQLSAHAAIDAGTLPKYPQCSQSEGCASC